MWREDLGAGFGTVSGRERGLGGKGGEQKEEREEEEEEEEEGKDGWRGGGHCDGMGGWLDC